MGMMTANIQNYSDFVTAVLFFPEKGMLTAVNLQNTGPASIAAMWWRIF